MLSFHKTLFFAFLLFVFWLPIPLGSNRPWAWSLNEIYVAFLLLGCLFLLPAAQCWLAIQRAKVILIQWRFLLYGLGCKVGQVWGYHPIKLWCLSLPLNPYITYKSAWLPRYWSIPS